MVKLDSSLLSVNLPLETKKIINHTPHHHLITQKRPKHLLRRTHIHPQPTRLLTPLALQYSPLHLFPITPPNNLFRLVQILNQTRRQKTVIPDHQFLIQSLNLDPRHIINMHHRPHTSFRSPFLSKYTHQNFILTHGFLHPFPLSVHGRRRQTQA